jgi:hypothetical protein
VGRNRPLFYFVGYKRISTTTQDHTLSSILFLSIFSHIFDLLGISCVVVVVAVAACARLCVSGGFLLTGGRARRGGGGGGGGVVWEEEEVREGGL